jgi:hypothetical protein
MLRQLKYLGAFIVFLLVIFVAAERAFSPSFQSCVDRKADIRTSSPTKTNPSVFSIESSRYIVCSGRFADSHGHGITALATVVIAAFTGTLWLVTGDAARAAKNTAEYAKTQLLVLERAYVVPGFSNPVPKDAAEWPVQVTLQNIGRSHGTIKGLFAQFINTPALPETPPQSGYIERRTDTVLLPYKPPWAGLLPFISKEPQEGQFICGYVIYEDIFGRTWKRHFAVQIWSEEKPGRHFYSPAGGAAYHSETQEGQDAGL